MDTLTTLTDLGLSQQEAAMYIACLKHGECPASVLAKAAGIQRTTAYPTLQALAKKGFVHITFKGRSRQYKAQRPTKLAHYYQERVRSFEQLIPQLNALATHIPHTTTSIRFIQSVEELETFYSGILDEYKHKQYCSIGSTTAWLGINPQFFHSYWKKRAAAGIRTKVLITEDSRSVNPNNTSLRRHVKYLPAHQTFKSTIDIYKNKILIINPDVTSLAVVIEIPAMTDIFQSIFDMLWEMLPN